MKKVLVLSSSPRKGGNSDTLCDQFIKGAADAGHAAEKIYVADQKIGYCKACYACRQSNVCVQHDDMPAILDKMLAADVIVLATPVYFFSMNAQMKTLIDRVFSSFMKLTDKEFYFIISAADDQSLVERAIDGLRGLSDCVRGGVVKGIIYGVNAWAAGDIKDNPAMQEAYNAGNQI